MYTQSHHSSGIPERHRPCCHPRTKPGDKDLPHDPMSLKLELGLINRLLNLSKVSRSRTLKAYSRELKARKRKLQSELEARSGELDLGVQ
jgi:hypothetical protein